MTSYKPQSDLAPGSCRTRQRTGPRQDAVHSVGDHAFVVSASDSDAVSLVYTVVREMTALLAIHHTGAGNVDGEKARLNVTIALRALADFDEVAKHAQTANRSTTALLKTGEVAKRSITAVLRAALDALGT